MIESERVTDALRGAWMEARRDRQLHLLLIAFILLSLLWNYVTPIFEAPDEPEHLQYALFLARSARLPNLWVEVPVAGMQAIQPPLYYAIAAVILRCHDSSMTYAPPTRNPDFAFEHPGNPPNYFLPVTESYDYVRVLRVLSTLFGLITIVCAYLSAHLLNAGRGRAIVVASTVAFLPQFVFISSSLSSDPLSYALASIGFVWLLYLVQLPTLARRHLALFGFFCGVAFLGKYHAAMFLLLFGFPLLVIVRGRTWRRALTIGVYGAFGFLAVSGWFLIHNLVLYGDPIALKLWSVIVPPSAAPSLFAPADIFYFTVALPMILFQSFLGIFGWMSIYLPRVIYQGYAALWLCALIGAIRGIAARRWDICRQALVLAPLPLYLFVVYTNLTHIFNQGRLFFPALDALALLFVFGLSELPSPLRRTLLVAVPVFLLATNLYSLWLVFVTFASG